MYSRGSEGFGLAFFVAIASLVAVVGWAITGELLGRKQELYLMIQWMARLSRAQGIYWDSVS